MRENIWIYRRINLIADLLLTALAYLAAAQLRAKLDLWFLSGYSPDYHLLLFILPVWSFFFSMNRRLYEYRMVAFRATLTNLSLTLLKCLGVLFGLLFLTHRLYPSRATLILFALLNLGFLLIIRKVLSLLLAYFRKRGRNQQKILLVGSGQIAQDFLEKSRQHPQWGWQIVGVLDWDYSRIGLQLDGLPVVENLDQLPRLLQNEHIDYVVYAVPRRFLHAVEESIATCEEMGAKLFLLADFFNLKIARQQFRFLFNQPALFYSTGPVKDGSLFFKYALDKIMALLILILLSPLVLLATILVKLTSPGPVWFKQTRCGLNGKKFTLYKFRTMVANAEELKSDLLARNEMSGPVFKLTDDPRLTKIGKFLRKSSIDELPQLFNVLKGEMSLVGPRPPLPQEVADYDRWQRRKLSIKPGLTCLWQVNGRNKIDFDHWMRLDLHYIDNWSLWLDAKILLKTVPAVLTGLGAK
jgi:exopolysaccharide biosynthesis polyprenyl glycosylphosphotransferase